MLILYKVSPPPPSLSTTVPSSPDARVKATLSKCFIWTWLRPLVPEPATTISRLQRLTYRKNRLLWVVGSIWFQPGWESITQSSHQQSVWPLTITFIVIRWRRTQWQQCKVRRCLLKTFFSKTITRQNVTWCSVMMTKCISALVN